MQRAGRCAIVGLTALAVACAAPRPESKPAASGKDEAEVVVRGLDEGGKSDALAPASAAAHPEAEQARKTFSPYARKYPIRAYFGDTHLGFAHLVYARAVTADRMKTPAAPKKDAKPARAGN